MHLQHLKEFRHESPHVRIKDVNNQGPVHQSQDPINLFVVFRIFQSNYPLENLNVDMIHRFLREEVQRDKDVHEKVDKGGPGPDSKEDHRDAGAADCIW